MKHLIRIPIIILLAALLTACGANQQRGTGIGAATGAGVGAIIGQIIGQDTKGTLIGAGIGAVVGGLTGTAVGAYMDKQEEELRRLGVGVQREGDSLEATFLSDFLFDFDSAELKPDAVSELDRVAGVLMNYPETTIRIEGHTDSTGTDSYNQALSERRAQTVKNTLARRGVEPWRLDTVGYGETHPVSSNAAENRRVVIVINPIRQS